jgi:inner membrane protein
MRPMDLVTQACLGAGLGELVLGRTLGARATAIGAALGVLPDADALLTPLLSDLQELTWHRSLTHSLVFCLAAPPLFAAGLRRVFGGDTQRREWLLFTYLVVVSHVLIDCCTTFGTQVFFPFSSYPVSFRCVSIVDPLVTVPLLFSVALCPFLARDGARRRWVNRVGLGLAAAYLLLLVGVKFHVDSVHRETLAREGVSASRIFSKPTFGNGILWRVVAEESDQFRVGYYSLLDSGRETEAMRSAPRGTLGDAAAAPNVKRLLEVLDGYASVATIGSETVIRDVRYGQWLGWSEEETPYVFAYRLLPVEHGVRIVAVPRAKTPPGLRQSFSERLKGR